MKRDTIIELLKTEGIKTIPFGEGMIRFVTHLDVDQQKIDYTIEKLGKLIIS
jgi:threonine aldolase